jgi:hypothetical protein
MDDKTGRHVKFAIIAFCFMTMIWMVGANMMRTGGPRLLDYILAIVIAAIVGGATYAVAMFMDL